jgi:hypothetical protein
LEMVFFFWVPVVKVLVLVFFWFCNVTVWEIKESRNFGFLLLLMLVTGRLTKPRFWFHLDVACFWNQISKRFDSLIWNKLMGIFWFIYDSVLKTALMQACRYGHWEVVQTLLLFRCNVSKFNFSEGNFY